MSRIVIVVDTSLDERWGGVPMHASHLMTAFPDATLVTSRRMGCEGIKNLKDRAEALGSTAVKRGLVNADDIIIADGFWGMGFPNQRNVVIVVHGLLESSYHGHPLSKLQIECIKSCKHLVAVGPLPAFEVTEQCGCSVDAVILNSVDVDLFKPSDAINPKTVAVSWKGEDDDGIKNQLADRLPGFEFNLVKGAWPDDIAGALKRSGVLVHLSKYEGNSYAVLEAMACGLPIVGTPVGLLWRSGGEFGPSVLKSASMDDVVNAVLVALEHRDKFGKYNRMWVEANATLPMFIANWQKYLGSIV